MIADNGFFILIYFLPRPLADQPTVSTEMGRRGWGGSGEKEAELANEGITRKATSLFAMSSLQMLPQPSDKVVSFGILRRKMITGNFCQSGKKGFFYVSDPGSKVS